MAAYVAKNTAQEVKDLLGVNYDTVNNPTLVPAFRVAGIYINNMIACAATRGYTHTDDELKDIELLLVAHFYQVTDLGYKSRGTLKANGVFQGETKMYLESTFYGQSAVNADASGCLAKVASKPRANIGFTWLGKPRRDRTDYDTRNN